MRLLSHLVDGEERLASALDDGDVADVADLFGDGHWTMTRLLSDPSGTLEALRHALDRDPAPEAQPPGTRPHVTRSLASLQLLAPVRPGKIVAVGRNYREHAAEESAALPPAPLLFAKFPSSLVGDGATITWSAGLTAQVDYEAELAVVIGRRVRNVTVERALDHVLGYSCLNDVSARDLQVSDGQWTRAKSLDTFCPMGPWLVTADEVPDPGALRVRCRVNGEPRQDASTAQLVHGVAELIAYCSRSFTLEPGDVIATGTPGGVGAFRDPPVFLADGDTVEVEVEGVGILTNQCRVVP
jgi:2-keto-4-pentenoate hydratase/2-oxohepta-3-ene-1,7-dioic acid hydratase in catechol pathway